MNKLSSTDETLDDNDHYNDHKMNSTTSNDQSSLAESNNNDMGGMGGGILGEDAVHDEAVPLTPPPSPVLGDAVTVRWLQADLSNSTAAAAVHNEVCTATDSIQTA